jgi:hypothetical protein
LHRKNIFEKNIKTACWTQYLCDFFVSVHTIDS